MVAIIVADYSPIGKGDTRRLFAPQFRHKNGKPVDLTGVTLSMKMVKVDGVDSGKVKTCTGPWVVQDAANGLANYRRQAAEVNETGTWNQEITLTDSNGPEHADSLPLVIKEVA